jgi:hypothetical protein
MHPNGAERRYRKVRSATPITRSRPAPRLGGLIARGWTAPAAPPPAAMRSSPRRTAVDAQPQGTLRRVLISPEPSAEPALGNSVAATSEGHASRNVPGMTGQDPWEIPGVRPEARALEQEGSVLT